MREIKFRAWDEKEKCWIGGFAIHQSGMFSDWAGCKKINGQCVAEAGWKYQHEIPHIKIMQYTGLKDKNGKEIYEGDILEEIGTDVYRYVVHWNVTNATYDFVDIITGETFHGDDIHFEKSEVISNIYEHPAWLFVGGLTC